jgi:hypothetical protein
MNLSTIIKKIRKKIKSGEDYVPLYEEHKDKLYPEYLSEIQNPNTRFEILDHFFRTGDRHIFLFAKANSDYTFEMNRYFEYVDYRKKNKFDSFSETYFKLKFGSEWEQNLKRRRDEKGNPYSVDRYITMGLSEDEAKEKVEANKKATAPNLQKSIAKHGEERGTLIYKNGVRRHKNYLDWWISRCNGDIVEATRLFTEYKRNANSCTIDFYVNRGYSKEEAIKLISVRQLNNAGLHRKYWENKGFTDEEINLIFGDINDRKDSASLDFLRTKFPSVSDSELLEIHKIYNMTKSSSFRENGYLRKDDPNLEEMVRYYEQVEYHTVRSINFMSECPGKRGRHVGSYHVDHKYSKKEGYLNNIPPEVVGHQCNLEWLLAEENCAKKSICSLTLEELYSEYLKHEN